MCGLVGFFGNIDQKAKKAFYFMHHFDVLRGRDGAGIYMRNFKGEDKLIKAAGTPDDLFWLYPKEFDSRNIINEPNLMLILGHNRWQTMGKVSDENAHPFEFDRIVGAHNGTISKYNLKQFPEYADDAVDSMILFSGINAVAKGELEKYKSFSDVFDVSFGSMALTWFDKQTRKLNIFRNSQRELYIGSTADEDLIVWASEEWMIKVACGRAGLALKEVVKYPEDIHSQFKVKSKNNKIKVRLVSEEKITKKVVTTSYDTGWNYPFGANLGEDAYYRSIGVKPFRGSDRKPNYHDQKPGTLPLLESNSNNVNTPVFSIFGETISIREFEHRTNYGCVMCGSGISFADRLSIKWLSKSEPICEECQHGKAIFDFITPDELGRLEEGKDIFKS